MIVISCYFGAKNTGVHPAPKGHSCYFFSNNPRLELACEAKGWRFIYMKDVPLSADPRIASLQSKSIKFLQFEPELVGQSPMDSILYFDHKFQVEADHIDQANGKCRKKILIRNTPREKMTIQEEIKEATGQKRYREAMPATRDWVDEKINKHGYRSENRIMNTGLIFYRDPEFAQPLCDAVYENCWLLGQPECQIIWGVLSQEYESQISRIEWPELSILWKEPDPDSA